MPFNLGGPELIIILVIVLIVFGAGKLPNVMRDVGRGVKEFKSASAEEGGTTTTTMNSSAAPAAGAPTTAANPAPVSGATNGTAPKTVVTTETSSRA